MKKKKGKKDIQSTSFRTSDSSSTARVLMEVVNQRVQNHRESLDPDGAIMADDSVQDHHQPGNQPSNNHTAAVAATTTTATGVEGVADGGVQRREQKRRASKEPRAKHALTVSSHGEAKKEDIKKTSKTARRSTSSSEVMWNVIDQRIENHRNDPDGQRIEDNDDDDDSMDESDHRSSSGTNVILEDIEEGCAVEDEPTNKQNKHSISKEDKMNMSDSKKESPPQTTTDSGQSRTVTPGAYRSNPGSSEDQPIQRSLSSIRRFFTNYTTTTTADDAATTSPTTATTSSNAAPPTRNDHTVSPQEVVAIQVDQEELENDIRRQIIEESVMATSVTLYGGDEAQEVLDESRPEEKHFKGNSRMLLMLRRLRFGICCCLLFLLVIIIVLAVTLAQRGSGNNDNEALQTNSNGDINNNNITDSIPEEPPLLLGEDSTMRRIADRGVLRCALTGDEDAEAAIDFRMCEVIASAVLGGFDNVEVETEVDSLEGALQLLDDGEVDIVMASRHTLSLRSIPNFRWSIPYMYDGLGFSGRKRFEPCVQNRLHIDGNCSDMKICIQEDQHKVDDLINILGESAVLLCADLQEQFSQFLRRECNVIAGLGYERDLENIEGYEGNGFSGRHLFDTSYIHSIVSLSEDIQWSNFIDVVLHGIVEAEDHGIHRFDAQDYVGHTDRFGSNFENMFVDALEYAGNFDEVLDTVSVAQAEQDELNVGDSGLLYDYELGDTEFQGPKLHPLGIATRIIRRGTLNCGVRSSRPGFADREAGNFGDVGDFVGIDVAYCRALSGSLFGDGDRVEFIELDDHWDAYYLLHDKEIDVYAGAPWIFLEDMSNSSLPFFYRTDPYFYGDGEALEFDEVDDDDVQPDLCLVTSGEDPQWAAYVSIIAKSLIFAYHRNYTQETFFKMPDVLWYGPSQRKMLAQAVEAVGNHGEIMARELEPDQRDEISIRNEINPRMDPGPQVYYSPGTLSLQ